MTIKQENLIKIKGTLTAPVQLKNQSSAEPYYYSFIRCKGQRIDLPVVFKEKPSLEKSDELELSGVYSNSDKNVRKSFTAYSYQLNNKRVSV